MVNLAKTESIPIDKFISEIVPNVDSIEIMLENRHMNNLVSLIALVACRPYRRVERSAMSLCFGINGNTAASIAMTASRFSSNMCQRA